MCLPRCTPHRPSPQWDDRSVHPRIRVRGGRRIASAICLCALVACSSSSAPRVHTPTVPAAALTGFTYQVPTPLPAGKPGDVIATSDGGPDTFVGGADRRVLVYHSNSATGRDIAVS